MAVTVTLLENLLEAIAFFHAVTEILVLVKRPRSTQEILRKGCTRVLQKAPTETILVLCARKLSLVASFHMGKFIT